MSDRKGPERLGDILARILRQRGLSDRGKLLEIQREITSILGPGRGEGARVRALQRGVLTLGIRSAPLRHEIENFYGREMLVRLQATPAGREVRRIRYLLEG